ncbi:MAG TPA: sensor histidine kinase [Sphaerochaeta sp.]|jgi:anti-sigma regulatory factor (Ser/Thr protein kinase)|nr:sensor histidine kinase [Spirochaetales bacterium]HQB54614.1 sensor histidine kinase [Sphaerochaeta sp.]
MHIAITDYVLEVVQNAFEANSTETRVVLQETAEAFAVTVTDNGKGMSEEVMKRVLDPFSTEEGKHPHRKVGLGLSFLNQATELAGGELTLRSEVGVGTTVRFTFDPASIDTPPLGDVVSTFMTLLAHPKAGSLVIERKTETDGYALDRKELIGVLGDLEMSGNLHLLKEYIASQEAALS